VEENMSELQRQSEMLVESLVRAEVKDLHSYHVPGSSGLLKLDAMENPFSWPGHLQNAWFDKLKEIDANRYPDPSASGVNQRLRKLLNVDVLAARANTELSIMLGNGSDEIIQILAMTLASKERGILAPEPSFVMYQMIAKFVGIPYHGVELNEDFSLDLNAFLSSIRTYNPSLIFLAVPNNPTGNLFGVNEVKAIVEASKGLVVVDEAYMAFTGSDLLPLIAEYPNIVVMRTLSKVGLAGLRLGFLIGSTVWLNEFDKLRLPYNINVLTQASAELALDNYHVLSEQTESLRAARSELTAGLQAIDGLQVYESEANFVLVRCLQVSAREVFTRMKELGVLIKCLDGGHLSLKNCLRLTVGKPQQNVQMLTALTTSLVELSTRKSRV
jgi:histidinol-phosphate aminotransferase